MFIEIPVFEGHILSVTCNSSRMIFIKLRDISREHIERLWVVYVFYIIFYEVSNHTSRLHIF